MFFRVALLLPVLLTTLPLRALTILPPEEERSAAIVKRTLKDYHRLLGTPDPEQISPPGTRECLVAGSPATNAVLKRLVDDGLELTKEKLGDEGFQLLIFEKEHPRYYIVYGNTPRALKHGLQELFYYHYNTREQLPKWPLNVVRNPGWPYRGIYVLPCWSAHDSYESWEKVIRFCSELTLNRVWFWLDGFPVAGHTGEYAGTALADAGNVQRIIDLAAAEDMKLLIGGGWFTWHHEKAVKHDMKKGVEYYLQYIDTFHNFAGFYIEPTGEENQSAKWDEESAALRQLVDQTLARKPEFEFALAIGKLNNDAYLRRMAKLDPKRVFWWWCWGDPLTQKALDIYSSVLRWHTTIRISDYHGSVEPPKPSEEKLSGFATSYDPGQGYGNPWNGWGKLGYDQPRNIDPYTIPYFGLEYLFRERCWNPRLTEDEFVSRLHRRLFDNDAPSEAGRLYWTLSRYVLEVNAKRPVNSQDLEPVRRLTTDLKGKPSTPRQQDTISRIEEALKNLPAK